MSACPDHEMLLHGLLDGELDAVNAAACEAHLKTCEGCHAEFLRLQALRAAVAAPEVAYRATPRLRASIEAALAAEAAPAKPRALRRAAPWAGGALGGLLAASLAVLAVAPQLTAPGLEAQLVDSHVRSLLAAHLTDIGTSNEHVVKPWFNGKVDIAPPVPELSAEGYPLVGGRLDYVDGRVVPAIVYKRHLHTVNLFVWPAGRGILGAGDKTVRRDGYSVVEWTRGGLRFSAVSDIGLGDLKSFRDAYIASAGATDR